MTATEDAFGDEMRFVESYGDFLPRSENIETAPVQNGISGISHNGDIYCLDCAKEMELVTKIDGHWVALVEEEDSKGEQWLVPKAFDEAPWTGAVRPYHETMTQYHCGRGRECCNSLEGDEHPYHHDLKIGIGIEEKVMEH